MRATRRNESEAAREYVRVSLRIRRDTRTPDEISEALKRTPDHAGVKGGRRGPPSSRAIWPFNCWTADFNEEQGPEERIASIARFVEADEQVFRALLESGGEAQIYAFIGVGRNEIGFTVNPSVLAILGRVGVELGLDIFPPPLKRARRSTEGARKSKRPGRKKVQ